MGPILGGSNFMKINMEPENYPKNEKENHLPSTIVGFKMLLVFGGE